jgi:PKD repeat protein
MRTVCSFPIPSSSSFLKGAFLWVSISILSFMPRPSFASPPQSAAPALAPTTTLAAETANNTSAFNGFATQGNGNVAPGNVSKQPVRSMLYSGSNTLVLTTWQPWFGGSGHMNVGYHSDDPAQVHRQVEDMISRGLQGVVIDWFGPNVPILSNASLLMQKEVEAHPGFQFAIMEDSGALFNAAVANGCDVTSQLISDLTFVNSTFVPSPAYLKIGGKPVIFAFGITQFFIDWPRVLASMPSGELLLFRGPEGMTQNFANGSFQWIDINSTDAFNQELGALDAFYTAAKASGRPAVGSTYKGFHDPLAMWGTNRQINQQCGTTWVNTFNEIGKFFSAGNQLPALQIVSWNDYEEGSEIETGIDNCAFLVPSASGNTLSWTLGGGTSESTIHHYTVFASPDGQNLTRLADVPAGTHSLNLSSFGLPSPVVLFVKAVGQSSIRNVMSAPVAMRAGDTPPAVVLNVTNTGNLSVQASSAGSTGNGGVSRVTIDFGDGAVVQSTTATHTYASAGSFNVTATVFDSQGASSVAVTRVEARSAGPNLTIFTPTNGSSVNWPTPIVASAPQGRAVTRTDVLIDGAPAFATDSGAINSDLKVFVGTHQISVRSTAAGGAVSESSVSVTGEPSDLPPTAAVTVVPLRQISPTTVMACSVISHDPDGFILLYKSQFSDGATFFTPAAVHTFAAPGSYSVTVNVIDQFGAPSSASQNFTVAPSAAAAGSTAAAQTEEMRRRQTERKVEPIRRP